jgi:hypothetical protein
MVVLGFGIGFLVQVGEGSHAGLPHFVGRPLGGKEDMLFLGVMVLEGLARNQAAGGMVPLGNSAPSGMVMCSMMSLSAQEKGLLAATEMDSLMKDPLSMKWLQAILMLSPDGGDGLAVPAVHFEVFVSSDAETSNGELFG